MLLEAQTHPSVEQEGNPGTEAHSTARWLHTQVQKRQRTKDSAFNRCPRATKGNRSMRSRRRSQMETANPELVQGDAEQHCDCERTEFLELALKHGPRRHTADEAPAGLSTSTLRQALGKRDKPETRRKR